jgi:mannose-6-phosphate isomerase-like protein (cupin superfamily)
MPELIESPVRVEAAGEPPKLIEEFAGRTSNAEERVSVARMRSPAGWEEPGQRPEFDEYTVVLAGALQVESEGGVLEVLAGQGVLVRAGGVGPLLDPRRCRLRGDLSAGLLS